MMTCHRCAHTPLAPETTVVAVVRQRAHLQQELGEPSHDLYGVGVQLQLLLKVAFRAARQCLQTGADVGQSPHRGLWRTQLRPELHLARHNLQPLRLALTLQRLQLGQRDCHAAAVRLRISLQQLPALEYVVLHVQ